MEPGVDEMTSRRSIAERVVARARARGTPIDDDAEFMAIAELWIAGEIEADGMRDRYNVLLKQRSRLKRGGLEVVAGRVPSDNVADIKTDIVSDPEAVAPAVIPTIREAR